jgi:hypothetical protein
MNFVQQMILKRKQQALMWPLQETRGLDPVQPPPPPQQGGMAPPPPQQGNIPKPQAQNLGGLADKLLAEGIGGGDALQGRQPLGEGMQSNPLTSGAYGSLTSRLNQQRKIDNTNKPSPLGGIV